MIVAMVLGVAYLAFVGYRAWQWLSGRGRDWPVSNRGTAAPTITDAWPNDVELPAVLPAVPDVSTHAHPHEVFGAPAVDSLPDHPAHPSIDFGHHL